jgi:hypothetical protein
MTRVHALASAALALAAAGCGPGDGSDRAMADLRSRVEAQAAEMESLRRQLAETDARARLLEERAAAATPPVPGAAAPASSAAPAAGPAEAAKEAAPAPDASSTEAYFESESGRQRLEAALEAVERRRQEQAAKERRERTRAMIEERVKGTLTERLGLDAQQQQTVLRVAVEAAERAEELFAGLREGRGDPSAFAQAREKGQQIRNDAMGQLQQALTVDQYNKLQEVMAEDRGGFLGFGGRGAIGGGGAGR